MKPIFVDTSALIVIGNKNDDFHKQAVIIQKKLLQTNNRFLITNAIVLELLNSFSQSKYKPIAIQLIKLINDSKQWHCSPIDKYIPKGIEMFQKRLDKDWSLVDCISIIVAKNYNVTDIFTTDHHFEQAGFTILLKN
ncbi:PIN domain-containing protein [Candidatus Halobeggiatoa sp. HSG11]|nr:PIN domain-containing protein [Candidatus Halobeggiatoa sp. HSG11]